MTDKSDKLENKPLSFKGQLGGARPNGGRPKGSVNRKNMEAKEALDHFKNRVHKQVDKLFIAQSRKALGESFLYRKYEEGTGAKRHTVTELVTDQETIIAFLNGDLDEDKEKDEFFYISTKPADNMAIDSLLNRAFGRPKETVDLKNNGGSFGDVRDMSDDELRSIIENRLNADD